MAISPRSLWLTPALSAFVEANNHRSWGQIWREWTEKHADQPAPPTPDKLRLAFKGNIAVKSRSPAKYRNGDLRACLCCARTFLSEGKHNRICQTCKTSVMW